VPPHEEVQISASVFFANDKISRNMIQAVIHDLYTAYINSKQNLKSFIFNVILLIIHLYSITNNYDN